MKTQPFEIWGEYEKGRMFKQSIGLYDTVKRNEAFFLGRQWEGLRVKSLDPLIFNVIRRCVNLFISMLVTDDVAVNVSPFAMSDADSLAIESAFDEAMERTGVKTLGRRLLRNACVDGDGCFYIHFDPTIQNGNRVQGELVVEPIDNTHIFFGNTSSDEVQKQPYLIVAFQKDLDEVRLEALHQNRPGCEINAIVPDSGCEESKLVTVLLKLWKEDGKVYSTKVTRSATLAQPKATPYTRYPIAYMSWFRQKHCYHGVSPVTEAIPNQIAINKLYSMYVQCIKQLAFPKIIYDRTRFPQGYSSDIGKAIGVHGNPNEAILSAFRPPDISQQVLAVLQQMMQDTMELMGASDVSLGKAQPHNTSAIVALQQATAAPLELTRMEFYRFTEDWARIFLDMMAAHYGTRTYPIVNENGEETQTTFDFTTLRGKDLSLRVEVGAGSYWSETMQTVTNDRLLERGIVTDPLLYLQNIPANQLHNKKRLLRSLKRTQTKEVSYA